MIRTICILIILVVSVGWPAQAKGINPVAAKASVVSPSPAPKTVAKSLPTKIEPMLASLGKQIAKSTVSLPVRSLAIASARSSALAISVVKSMVTETSAPRKVAIASSKGIANGVSLARSGAVAIGELGLGMASHLARLTAYWASEGDYYTRHCLSSTGIHLHGGHCAVDPRIIPYGSVVEIAGVGKYLAVDTGSAVIDRQAARECAHTPEERNALVIDLYFESRRDGENFAATGPKYAAISWWAPTSTVSQAKEDRSLFADENWARIQNKQL